MRGAGGGKTPAKTKTKTTFSPKAGLAQCRVCSRSFAEERIQVSASKSSIRRFVITEKAPTRAFSWLKAATTAFTFKTLC